MHFLAHFDHFTYNVQKYKLESVLGYVFGASYGVDRGVDED